MMLELGDAETEKEEEKDIVYVLKATDTSVEARLNKEEKSCSTKQNSLYGMQKARRPAGARNEG